MQDILSQKYVLSWGASLVSSSVQQTGGASLSFAFFISTLDSGNSRHFDVNYSSRPQNSISRLNVGGARSVINKVLRSSTQTRWCKCSLSPTHTRAEGHSHHLSLKVPTPPSPSPHFLSTSLRWVSEASLSTWELQRVDSAAVSQKRREAQGDAGTNNRLLSAPAEKDLQLVQLENQGVLSF